MSEENKESMEQQQKQDVAVQGEPTKKEEGEYQEPATKEVVADNPKPEQKKPFTPPPAVQRHQGRQQHQPSQPKIIDASGAVKVQNVNPNTPTIVKFFEEYRDNMHGHKTNSLDTVAGYQRKLNNTLAIFKGYNKPAEIVDCLNRIIEIVRNDLKGEEGHKEKSAFTVLGYNRALGAVGKSDAKAVQFISHFMRLIQMIAERGKPAVRGAVSMDVFPELSTNPVFNKTLVNFVNGQGK